ncbi:CG31816 [Drosophila busckii]|uniref:CG31816 n=1 Tax=Drosophila busckii TaxID=30019 RepID=A0A0M3QU51_DROBS|nr:CG31816 [Drosophila busckii]
MTKVEKTKEWSRSQICLPKDNLKTEGLLRAQRHVMVSTIETCCAPINMSMLIGMEYARMWQRNRDKYTVKRQAAMGGRDFKNDYAWWLKLHKTNRCFCSVF